MILFNTIRWKNFMSTGNTFTEVDLRSHKSTLIVGHNGSGKSTMLDAMSFALFGKPHRNINKPQLVNSINNKSCIVEIEFGVGSAQYKVVRGLKPTVFEIWKNGEMINQDSHAKEYQKLLEQNIIKLNHKSFHQIVVLGSSSFIPFMQLSAQHRRDVIEDLLDINVFSKMNNIIKEKTSILKEKLKDVAYQLDINKKQIDSQKKYIRDITQMNDDEIVSKHKQISEIEDEIYTILGENGVLWTFVEAYSQETKDSLATTQSKQKKLLEYKTQFTTKIKDVVRDAKFYEENSDCPTCTQPIEEELRSTKLTYAKSTAVELDTALKKIKDEENKMNESINKIIEFSDEIRESHTAINANNQSINRLNNAIMALNTDIGRLDSRTGDLNGANDELSEMKDMQNSLMDERLIFNEQASYNSVMGEMLKDTGIKTKVIKQYVPIINNLVNQYLQVLEFFVHFNLDETFQETIRSRHRDAFSYDSFSEGEKQRIDLALLFTWRQIAKMKNSVATNLLVLDETFDSSLDHDGVDNLMKILYTLGDDTNVFVISHKGEMLEGKFKNKLEFFKEKNFSKMKNFGLHPSENIV